MLSLSRRLSFILCLSLLSCSAARKESAIATAIDTATGSSKAMDFIYYQRLIFVALRLNGQGEFLFLLDTGASASAIDNTTVARLDLELGERTEVEGTAGTVEAHRVRIDSVTVGGETIENITATGRDLSGLLAPPGKRVDGILGYDFLRFFSIRIDFADTTISFSRDAHSSNDRVAGGAAIPFVLDNGIPRITGILNDTLSVDFRLDTGASIFETEDVYLNITEETWVRLTTLNHDLKPVQYLTGSGVGGDIQLAVARIDRLTVGDVSVQAPFVIVQPRVGYFANEHAVGFISNNLLEKFGPVVIDYPRTLLHLNGK